MVQYTILWFTVLEYLFCTCYFTILYSTTVVHILSCNILLCCVMPCYAMLWKLMLHCSIILHCVLHGAILYDMLVLHVRWRVIRVQSSRWFQQATLTRGCQSTTSEVEELGVIGTGSLHEVVGVQAHDGIAKKLMLSKRCLHTSSSEKRYCFIFSVLKRFFSCETVSCIAYRPVLLSKSKTAPLELFKAVVFKPWSVTWSPTPKFMHCVPALASEWETPPLASGDDGALQWEPSLKSKNSTTESTTLAVELSMRPLTA